MSRQTFMELCQWLTPALRHQDTAMRRALPVEKRVGIAVWKLATPDSYRSVGQQFGVGKATVGAVLMEVVRAINVMLLHRLVRLGDPDATITGFATLGFPSCFGALDGTHIPIRTPHHSGGRFINSKGYHSVVLQALPWSMADLCRMTSWEPCESRYSKGAAARGGGEAQPGCLPTRRAREERLASSWPKDGKAPEPRRTACATTWAGRPLRNLAPAGCTAAPRSSSCLPGR
ncbi:uncharacterized protein LOC142012915 [Carettochelys insculpta]|uniref:uncharacterized protein LOC142012915 n=1 Tax=Carettochelys insculpta TaxID=44489 RepID=UPI003EB6B9CD